MKILHINCNYMTTALHQTMMEQLQKTGTDNHVFAPVRRGVRPVVQPKDYVCVSECFKKWDKLCFDYKQKKIFRALEQAYSVQQFDLLHAYTLFTDGNCALSLKKKYGVPYVVAIRSTDVNAFFKYRPWLRRRGVEIMQQAEAVFFLSEKYADTVLKKFVPGKLADRIRSKSQIIPNGIDDFWLTNSRQERASTCLRDRRVRLIAAGKINANKNQLTAAKAVRILRQQGYNATLCVVGPTEDPGIARRLQQFPGVTVLPARPKEALSELYRENDIFILPSYCETFGLVYAEAMSQGLPVLYSAGQGFDGQFPEGQAGYRIDPHSPKNIADTVCKLLERCGEISLQVPALARQFCWKDITNRYAAIYRAIASEGAR